MEGLQNLHTDLTVPVAGRTKDPETGDTYRMMSGRLFAVIMDFQEHDYLTPDGLPKELLGADSPYMIRALMVNGEPAVPVTAHLTFLDGCTATLKPEAYTRERETNANYRIAAKVTVGPVEYALAENPETHCFATWERTPGNDKPGERNYYWGHYHDDRGKAIADFCARASEKCVELEQGRKPSVRKQLSEKPPEKEPPAVKPRDKGAR